MVPEKVVVSLSAVTYAGLVRDRLRYCWVAACSTVPEPWSSSAMKPEKVAVSFVPSKTLYPRLSAMPSQARCCRQAWTQHLQRRE